MWRRHACVVLTSLLLLSACADDGPDPESPSGTTTTTPSPTDPNGSDCPFDDDIAEPAKAPRIEIQLPGAADFSELSDRRQVGCRTRLRVDEGGSVDVFFSGRVAACQLLQDRPEKVAAIITRDGRGTLLRIFGGRALCTLTDDTQVKLCGLGTLLVTGDTQVGMTCDPDPVFNVLAYAGSVGAIDPNEQEMVIPPGMGVEHSFESGETRPVTANFNPPDEAVFAQQAAFLGLAPLPQGAPMVNENEGTFEAFAGDWSGSPSPTFTYQWQNGCLSEDGPEGCADIAGATQSTYTLTASDCPRVRVVVTGSSANGSNTATSEARPIDFLFDCESPSQSVSDSPSFG